MEFGFKALFIRKLVDMSSVITPPARLKLTLNSRIGYMTFRVIKGFQRETTLQILAIRAHAARLCSIRSQLFRLERQTWA